MVFSWRENWLRVRTIAVTMITLLAASVLAYIVLHHREAMSFAYELDYSWHYSKGGHLIITRTDKTYTTQPIHILAEVTTLSNGWLILPYNILTRGLLTVLGPAKAEINLGNITDGNYTLSVIMRDAVDEYEVHKTYNMFWVKEINSTYGMVVEKEEFEKCLDGFTVEFMDARFVDHQVNSSKMKDYTLSRVEALGGTIVDEYRYTPTDSLLVRFYYQGELQDLAQIIIDLAKMDPSLHIAIFSNTQWRILSWTLYDFVILVYKLDSFGDIKNVLHEEGLKIANEDTYGGSREGEVYYTIYASSLPTEKVATEVQNDLINTISEKLELTYNVDYVILL